MRIDGKWEGKLLDASGPQGLVTLHLSGSGQNVAGDFAVSFVAADERCGCDGALPRPVQTGPVAGSYDARTNRARFTYDLTLGLEPVTVSFEGVVHNADPHARRAMVGCYHVARGTKELTLEGGGCVLWLYANEPPKRTARAKRRA